MGVTVRAEGPGEAGGAAGAQGASASYTRGLARTPEVRRKGGQRLVMNVGPRPPPWVLTPRLVELISLLSTQKAATAGLCSGRRYLPETLTA